MTKPILVLIPVSYTHLIRSKQEEQRISERILENYRNQAENNEHILEIHHEIRHHMNALSSYLKQEDYAGARQYTQKFTEEAEQLPFVTYTANALVNSILLEFAERASRYKAIVEYSIIIGRKLNMEDIDLCRMLTNILENAVEAVSYTHLTAIFHIVSVQDALPVGKISFIIHIQKNASCCMLRLLKRVL